MTSEGFGADDGDGTDPELTGRYLVSFENFDSDTVRALTRATGITAVASSSDYQTKAADATLSDGPELLIFESINAGILTATSDLRDSLSASAEKVQLLDIEPEHFIHAASPPEDPYLAGFRDGVVYAIRGAGAQSVDDVAWATGDPAFSPDVLHTDAALTWALGYLGISESSSLGEDVPVAILDSGIDVTHVDFVGRSLNVETFVPQQALGDPYGHGTHCAGILAGPRDPSGCPRYGVAPAVDLRVGKVLDDEGDGTEGGLLNGITWAAANGARVVSMSVSTKPRPGQKYSRIFERTARALAERENSVSLVAAAGNDSDRSRHHVVAVGRPANSPSVIAVAAINQALRVANFSNGSRGWSTGQIDIAAPGVNILSAWPGVDGPRVTMDGTSMATPHVAGVLAHLITRLPTATARDLGLELQRHAKRLLATCADVGAGLVQVPA